MNYEIPKQKLWGVLLACGVAFGQPSNVHVRASYPTQTVLCGTVNPALTYAITVTADGSAIPDVDATLFAGSNQDTSREDTVTNGTERCVVIGHRVYGTTGAGRVVSRATEADKVHSYNWGGTSGTFTTPTIPLNNSHSDPWQVGDHAILSPTFDYTNQNQVIIDPLTGARIKRFDLARQETKDFPQDFAATEPGTGWVNPSNSLSNSDSSAYASYSGTTQDWLYLRGPVAVLSQQLGELPEIDFIGLTVNGYCSGSDCATAANRLLDVQMTWDGVTWSNTYQMTLPNGAEGSVSSYGPSGSSGVAGQFWFSGTAPGALNWAEPQGLIYNSSTNPTVSFTADADCDVIRPGDLVYVEGTNFTVSALDCAAAPHTMTLSGAVNAVAPAGMSGWPYRYANGWQHNAKVGFRIRKNSGAANADVRIQYAAMNIGSSATITGSSGGFFEHCNKNATEHGKHLCIFGDRLFAFDTMTGDVTFMGTSYMSCPGVNPGIWGSTGNMWSTVNARRLFASAAHNSGDFEPGVVAIDIAQDDLTPAAGFSVFSPTQPAHTCTDLTPSGHGLITLMTAYDPHFNASLYNTGAISVLANDDVFIIARRGIQDTRGYAGVFRVGNMLPVGSGGTGGIVAGFYLHEGPCSLSTEFCMNWMGYHTVFSLDDAPGWVAFQHSGMKNQATGSNPLGVTLQNYWNGSSWMPGLPIQAANTEVELQIGTLWNPAWGTQPAGFVNGDPVSDCVPGGCVNTGDTSGDYWHGPLQVGTSLCRDYFTPECMLVTEIISPTRIKVKRGYGTPDSFWNPQAWNSGDKLYIESKEAYIAAIAWNYDASPHGADASAFVAMRLPGGGHTVVKNHYASGSPDQAVYILPGGLNSVSKQYLNSDDPTQLFQAVRAAHFGGQNAYEVGECTEGHLSVAYERGRALTNVDIHPTIGGPGCWNSGTSQASLQAWPIYKWSGLNLHAKHFPLLAIAGDKALKNISGPGSTLTTSASDWYKVCVVAIAGECYSGSAVGDVYASAPNVRPGQAICSVFSSILDDLCIGDFPSDTSRLNLYASPAINDSSNPAMGKESMGTAVLSTVGLRGKPVANTNNGKLLPGGNWAFYGGEPRPYGLIAKLPAPWTKDGVDRTTWVPRTVTIRPEDLPMGTASVVVKFGYAFCPDTATDPAYCNGSHPNHAYYCSRSRADVCYVVTAKVNEATPYLWASEWNPATQSVACASGCTVELPTAYGSVVHAAVVYLNGAGTVLATSPRLVESAAPAKELSVRGDLRIDGDLR